DSWGTIPGTNPDVQNPRRCSQSVDAQVDRQTSLYHSLTMIRQMRYYLLAMGAWNLVRAFIHSFHHGYDILFELRMLACIVPLCFAALAVIIEQAMNRLQSGVEIEFIETPPDVTIPRFRSLDL